jgi:hypothetical protein
MADEPWHKSRGRFKAVNFRPFSSYLSTRTDRGKKRKEGEMEGIGAQGEGRGRGGNGGLGWGLGGGHGDSRSVCKGGERTHDAPLYSVLFSSAQANDGSPRCSQCLEDPRPCRRKAFFGRRPWPNQKPFDPPSDQRPASVLSEKPAFTRFAPPSPLPPALSNSLPFSSRISQPVSVCLCVPCVRCRRPHLREDGPRLRHAGGRWHFA